MGFFGRKKENKTIHMELSGFPGDTQTDKCLLMAKEKGVQLNVKLLDVLEGACEQQDYRAISPFGKCPCLKEGSFVTSGATSILAYLDVRGQGGQLNPKKAAILGHQNYWVQIATQIAEPAVKTLMQESICGPMKDSSYAASEELMGTASEKLQQVLDALDGQLADKGFIVGEYSYADIHWTSIAHLYVLLREGVLLGEADLIESRKHVSAWYKRVQARPSFTSLPTLDDIKQKQLRSVA